MTFQRQLEVGKTGEGIIATWVRSRGFSVLPVYEKEQGEYKGPALYTVESQLIAPDMFAFKKDGRAVWIEAKTKSAFTWHRITQKWVTGIDLKNYFDYLKMCDVSPWPIYLLFLHYPGQAKDSPSGCPSGLFANDIIYLRSNENHRHQNGGRGGMVYWAHDTLTRIATLDEVLQASQPQALRQSHTQGD